MKLASKKAKIRALKTDENKITLKITAILLNFVFLCWRFVAHKSGIFKIMVWLAKK